MPAYLLVVFRAKSCNFRCSIARLNRADPGRFNLHDFAFQNGLHLIVGKQGTGCLACLSWKMEANNMPIDGNVFFGI